MLTDADRVAAWLTTQAATYTATQKSRAWGVVTQPTVEGCTGRLHAITVMATLRAAQPGSASDSR